MSKELNKNKAITTDKKVKQFYYPAKGNYWVIDDGDWNRWVRDLNEVPEMDTRFRDCAYTCIGISVPISIVGILNIFTENLNWENFIYILVGSVSLVIAILCFIFDKAGGKREKRNIVSILEDMKDVKERSTKLVEEVNEYPE